jgi:hypothetical protein
MEEPVSDSDNSGAVASLQAEVKFLVDITKRHDKAIFGNGTPGLIQTVARLEGAVNTMSKTVALMEESSRHMERSAASMALHTEQVAKSAKAAQARITELEKAVKPLIDWKRGIYLRITTIGATLTAIFGAIWFIVDNLDKIKAFLK